MKCHQQMQLAVDDEMITVQVGADLRARDEIERAAFAVFAELGLCDDADVRRNRVVSRIATSWNSGHRQPLNLVNAGLDAACA